MKGALFRVVLVITMTLSLAAQETPAPEECIAPREGAVRVTHAGKTYRLTTEACRTQFLSDPERFAQLYDALLDLEQEGTSVRASSTASLVPS